MIKRNLWRTKALSLSLMAAMSWQVKAQRSEITEKTGVDIAAAAVASLVAEDEAMLMAQQAAAVATASQEVLLAQQATSTSSTTTSTSTSSTTTAATANSTTNTDSSSGSSNVRMIRIVTADSLELRQIDGQEFVIIAGERVELRVGDDVVKAQRVEYNRVQRILTLLGEASYLTAKTNQTLSGDNLVVDLAAKAVSGEDVLISDDILEIRGMEVERIPGQLRTTRGSFTLCARCGRTPNDYSVRAEEMILYPGDRIIARKAQVMLGDIPVLYLPLLAVPLNEANRQPSLTIENKEPDGLTVAATLPFAASDNIMGVTRFNYYEKRQPVFGGGVDFTIYSPNDYVDRVDIATAVVPKPLPKTGGYQTDFSVNAVGRIPLADAKVPLSYTFGIKKVEIGLSETTTNYGASLVNFDAKTSYERFDIQLSYLDRWGKPLDDNPNTSAVTQPHKKAEVVVNPKNIDIAIGKGEANADFKFTVGQYSAASNPESRLASLEGKYLTATRLESVHSLRYSLKPWDDADISFSNSFVGRYYSTGSRTVDLRMAASFSQRFGKNKSNRFSVSQSYNRLEGTSPFAFDRLSVNRLVESAPFNMTIAAVPDKSVSTSLSYSYDFIKPKGQSEAKNPAKVNLSLSANKAPVSNKIGIDIDIAEKHLTNLSYSLTLADPKADQVTTVPAKPAVAATATTPAQAAQPAYSQRHSWWPAPSLSLSLNGGYAHGSGLKPINLVTTISPPDFRTNSLIFKTTFDLRPNQKLLSGFGVSFSYSSPYDVVINPVSVTGSEDFAFAKDITTVKGDYALNWRDLTLRSDHNFTFDDKRNEQIKHNGRVNLSLGNTAGSALNWKVNYGGNFDTVRGGFTEPKLSASINSNIDGKVVRAALAANLKGFEQKHNEFSDASIQANWQEGNLAVGGRASYRRRRGSDDKFVDTLIFDPLQIGLGLQGSGTKPEAYLTATLRQTFSFREDDADFYNAPIAPVIGLTVDRCCWALRGEIDPLNKRFKIALGLPGQYSSIFEATADGVSSPLWPFNP